MQQNSFFLGCNYPNREITTDAASTTGWSLCPVQDIDTVLTNRYGVNGDDPFSALYSDLYRRQLKQALKHTMLVQESVYESQIHELHRLYRRQKELMMEMERTRHHQALYSGFSIPRSHWMCSSISPYQTGNFPHEQDNQAEFLVDNKVEKSEKKFLDLELPIFECNGKDETRGCMNGEVHEVANFLKEQSLESVKQSNKLQLDLNEPAKTEELSSVTSNEKGEESDVKYQGEDSVKGSSTMNEAKESVNCQGAEYGIDLNMSPIALEEEVAVVKKFENEKPQESSSVSLHGEHRSKQFRVIVQALPCSNSSLLLNRGYKRGSRPKKKVKKLGRSKGFDLDSYSSVQATSESLTLRKKMKGSSSSWSMTKSARNQTDLGKKRRFKPQKKTSDGQKVVAKKKRKKSRRICLVNEENYQEISAAEAIVDISGKSGQEISDCITSIYRNLFWLAEISTSDVMDYEIDKFEAMTMELTEMKLEEHKMNPAENETEVSSIVLGKKTRSRRRQGKRKCREDQSFGAFSECGANEDLEVIGKLIEASESKYDLQVKWGAIKKRRRGSRFPAADFQHMIINQVVVV